MLCSSAVNQAPQLVNLSAPFEKHVVFLIAIFIERHDVEHLAI